MDKLQFCYDISENCDHKKIVMVAKSWVSNRSDSKKSEAGGNSKKSYSGTQKVGLNLSGIVHFLLQILCFLSQGRVWVGSDTYPT